MILRVFLIAWHCGSLTLEEASIVTKEVIRFVDVQVEQITPILGQDSAGSFKSWHQSGLVHELVNQVLLIVSSATPVVFGIVPPREES